MATNRNVRLLFVVVITAFGLVSGSDFHSNAQQSRHGRTDESSRSIFTPFRRFVLDAISSIASRSALFGSSPFYVPHRHTVAPTKSYYTEPPVDIIAAKPLLPASRTVVQPSAFSFTRNNYMNKGPFYVPNRRSPQQSFTTASAPEEKQLEIIIPSRNVQTNNDNTLFNTMDDEHSSTASSSCVHAFRRKLKCPLDPGYFTVGSSCYYLEPIQKLSLFEARDRCAELNDDSGQSLAKWKLAAFNSFGELNAIAPYLRMAHQVFGSNNMWIEQVRTVESLEEAILLHTPYMYVDPCDGPAYTLVPEKMTVADLRAHLKRDKFCNLLSINGTPPQFDQECQDTRLAFLCEVALNGDPSTFSSAYVPPIQ